MGREVDDECTGAGKCHGCLKWCDTCGDVAHVCDARLRGERCAKHPVPPSALELRGSRSWAEQRIAEGRRLQREGQEALGQVEDEERARRSYDMQMVAEERRIFGVET